MYMSKGAKLCYASINQHEIYVMPSELYVDNICQVSYQSKRRSDR